MKGQDVDMKRTLSGREYEQFLRDYGFRLVLDDNGDRFSCTVFQNRDLLLAFTYQMNFGENLAVAELGAPIDVVAIAGRSDGWSLIGEVWKDAYEEFHKARAELPYPHNLDRQHEIVLIDRALRSFMSKIRAGEVSVSHPAFRM